MMTTQDDPRTPTTTTTSTTDADAAPSGTEPAEPTAPRAIGVTRRRFVGTVGAGAVGVAALSSGRAAAAAPAPATPIYRIHPAIGVARVGNLDPSRGYIIGPEVPGARATDGATGGAVTSYKVDGLIKPQAARFRIWEYERGADGRLTPKGEVLPQTPTNRPYVKAITWRVHLANVKASFYKEDGPTGETQPAAPLRNPTITDRASLESDFGPRTIAGRSAPPQVFSPATAGSYPVHKVRAHDGSTLIDYLGQLRTDAAGRLLVLGGKGKAASSLSPPQPLTHWANNNYWFDDVSDGPVTATVTLDDGRGNLTEVEMDPAGHAWVLVGPPDFSPGLQASVSLYDLLHDLAVRELPIPADNKLYDAGGPLARLRELASRWDAWQAGGMAGTFELGDLEADFLSEIWPIVVNAVNLVYTTALVNFKHSNMLSQSLGDPSPSAARDRERFFSYIRAPEDATTNNNGPATMPVQYGDNWYLGENNFSYDFGQDGNGNAGGGGMGGGPRSVPKWQRYATLTRTQYALLRSWQAGHFDRPPASPPPPSTAITPHGLDRAALENCNGGPLYPGIECGWQMRNPNLFIEPFRLDPSALSQYLGPDGQPESMPLRPGHFSRQMALPWTADFKDCSKLLNLAWWPAARPDDVFLNAGDRLLDRVPWMRPTTTWASGSTSPEYGDMTENWYKLGFVLDDGAGFYLEKERNSQVP